MRTVKFGTPGQDGHPNWIRTPLKQRQATVFDIECEDICMSGSVDLSPSKTVRNLYEQLVVRRKACHCCAGLTNPSVCNQAPFDADQIGPWTLWQGNLNSDLAIIGQDWGDTAYFTKNSGHEKVGNPTNETLRQLLSVAGVHIKPPSTEDSGGGDVFFTNAVLCLKQGGMQAPVDPKWFANCGKLFLRPTLDLVAPAVIVTLGRLAYEAVCKVYGLPPKKFRDAVESDGTTLNSGASLVPVYHCGSRILNTHRPLSMQKHDWERVGRLLSTLRNRPQDTG